MGFWDLYQKIENFFGDITDGWKGYLMIAVVSILLLIFIAVFIIMAFNNVKPDPMSSRSVFSDSAKSFCIEKGFNSMEWINNDDPANFNYTCINREQENKSIEDYYVEK